jgi:pyrimidine operon attenuation protein/uracil phosphoribosyltransferase
MPADLTTTNVLLGIIATVSVLEALVVVGLLAGGVMMFRRMMGAVARIEAHQIAPATKRVNEILDDVKSVTEMAKRAAGHADRVTGWWRVFRGTSL